MSRMSPSQQQRIQEGLRDRAQRGLQAAKEAVAGDLVTLATRIAALVGEDAAVVFDLLSDDARAAQVTLVEVVADRAPQPAGNPFERVVGADYSHHALIGGGRDPLPADAQVLGAPRSLLAIKREFISRQERLARAADRTGRMHQAVPVRNRR